MSFNGKKNRDFGGNNHKLTPEEKRVKEEEHEKKMEEARKEAEEKAADLINRSDVVLGEVGKARTLTIPKDINTGYSDPKFLERLDKDLDTTISFFKKLTALQVEFQTVHRGNLCEETAGEFSTRVSKVNGMASLMKTTFKNKLYAVMDATLSAKDLVIYMDILHPLAFKAHDVKAYDENPMLSWDECTEKFSLYDKLAEELNAPLKKKLIDEHTAIFKPIVERFNQVDLKGEPLTVYGTLLSIWTDLIPVIYRQEHLEKPRDLDKLKISLFEALSSTFARCKFGEKMFPRCDEETKLHIKAYMTSPILFNQCQDEFEAIRKSARAGTVH